MAFQSGLDGFRFVSELYQRDAPQTVLLPEYPSSNNPDAPYRNTGRWIIHDPFPPPDLRLIRELGPHHLMCAWGSRIPVTSTVRPPEALLDHWERVLGPQARPAWQEFDPGRTYTTIFPLESLAASQQEIDPETCYALHGKQALARIDCRQPEPLQEIVPPCMIKLSHGYAGLGNYLVRDEGERQTALASIRQHWPTADLFVTRVIENIVGDYGAQFYVHRNGETTWLGFTHQIFDPRGKWTGATFSAHDQDRTASVLGEFTCPVSRYLHSNGYYGVAGIDVLEDHRGKRYLVDLNPRLTGVTPFLFACREFLRAEDIGAAVYAASTVVSGSVEELIRTAEAERDARILVYAAIESGDRPTTTCHLSVHGKTVAQCQRVRKRLTG